MKNLLATLLCLISFCGLTQTVKMMTYNIRFATPHDGVNEWKLRKSEVSDLIKKYDPDMIGVQEALLSQIEDIIKDLPDYTYVGVGRDDGKTKGEYSAILFKKDKFKVRDQNTFWLSETPEVPGSKHWDAAITRVATWGRFTDVTSDKEFVVINTHFDHIGAEARKNSADLLVRKSAKIAKGQPLLVMGDFNCTRDEPPYKVMISAGTNLKDPAPADPPGTFCTFAVDSIPCKAIDYLFYSPDWTATKYNVITDNDGKYYPSDHLPVMAEFTLGKKNRKKSK